MLRGVLSDVFTLPDGTEPAHGPDHLRDRRRYTGRLRDETDGSSDAARGCRLDQLGELPLAPYVHRALAELR